MARAPIHAAGGIVFRRRKRPVVAVVQRSKDERWVLPRGKLKRKEDPLVGARREVLEETGHRAEAHEFLGAITYRTRGRPKVVQFWRMQAAERPSRDVMADVLRVEWLPLKAAVRRLTFPLEKLFLAEVGGRLLREHRKRVRASKARARRKKKKNTQAARPRRKTARVKGQTKRRAVKRQPRKAKRPSGPAKSRRRKLKVGAHRHPETPVAIPISLPVARSIPPPRRGNILRRVLGRLAR